MFIFRKARKPQQTLNDLDAWLKTLGDEPVKWLAREVQSWGQFSYDELAAAIEAGRLDDLIDWQNRYAEVVNGTLAPMWLKAIEEASKKATRGMIVLSDSNDYVKAWVNSHGGELITRLAEESRKAIMNVILRGQGLRMAPRDIAKEVRPLIGLTNRQVEANQNYRQKVYERYREHGASERIANERADKAALKYAGKQHRYRAESIVLTENAFAYNRGAHMGVSQSIADGLMGRCEMVWTTAGTNRVCGRCMALKDTVVGHTDESGVTLPPLHPRCRCAIMYREIGTPRVMQPKPRNENGLQRPSANQGVFAHLEVPMQLRAVKQVCRKYGVDISGLRIKIQRGEDLLKYLYAGSAAPEDIGRIDLFPNAFANEEQILRTVIHEGCHVKQFKKYGSAYVQEHRREMEDVAERYEKFFFRIARRAQHGS